MARAPIMVASMLLRVRGGALDTVLVRSFSLVSFLFKITKMGVLHLVLASSNPLRLRVHLMYQRVRHSLRWLQGAGLEGREGGVNRRNGPMPRARRCTPPTPTHPHPAMICAATSIQIKLRF
jgi:hypothetical protein